MEALLLPYTAQQTSPTASIHTHTLKHSCTFTHSCTHAHSCSYRHVHAVTYTHVIVTHTPTHNTHDTFLVTYSTHNHICSHMYLAVVCGGSVVSQFVLLSMLGP